MLQLEIITPEKIVFSDLVDMVSVPSSMGTLGILPHHTALFAQLIEGELQIKKEGQVQQLAIGGGFIEVSREKVIVLVTRAVHATALNEEEIVKAQENAREALKQKPTGDAYKIAQTMLRQSIVDMRLLNKRKRSH